MKKTTLMKVNQFSALFGLINQSVFVLFFLFMSGIAVHSQERGWQWIQHGGANNNDGQDDFTEEITYDVETDKYGNIYGMAKIAINDTTYGSTWDARIAGEIIDRSRYKALYKGVGVKNVIVYSLTSDGALRWYATITGKARAQIQSMELDSEGNVYIAGRIGDCQNSIGKPDTYANYINGGYSAINFDEYIFDNSYNACNGLFMAKFDNNGVLQYVVRPQPNTTSIVTTLTSTVSLSIQDDKIYWAVRLPPGTYADGAFTNTNTEDNNTPYVLQYNLDGTFVSATQLGTVSALGYGQYIFKRNPYNGNYVTTWQIAGGNPNLVVNGENIDYSFIMLCYDSSGNLLWKRHNTNPGRIVSATKVYDIAFDPQNNIYLLGSMCGNGSGDDNCTDSFLGFTPQINNIPLFVMKTNPDATSVLWAEHTNIHHGVFYEEASGIFYNNNTGKVAITSNCAVSFSLGEQTIEVNDVNQGRTVLLAEIEAETGKVLPMHYIKSDFTVNSLSYGKAITVDKDGNYIVGGQFRMSLYDSCDTKTTSIKSTDMDFFIAKFGAVECTTTSTASAEQESFKIYPNPTNGQLTIDGIAVKTVTVTDITGKTLVTASTAQLDISALAKGVYFIIIETESGTREMRKVVKE